ncbi:MAG: endonuclease/exonuclease/phosphatase family protein [Pseudomonadota bacterium]
MKISSWNLLHRSGASVDEVAQVLDSEAPDLLLMQEATPEIARLKDVFGGYYLFQPWPGKRYGMAIWSSKPVEQVDTITLPHSRLPGRFPIRAAQLVRMNDITVTNVHLSHGQLLNRRQLARIADKTEGPTVIMGDFNAVGPIRLGEFSDVGPKAPTHKAQNILPFRLDRCLVRALEATETKILEPLGSDHHPIVVSLDSNPSANKNEVSAAS